MLEISLPEDIERRLERLANATGRTEAFTPARPFWRISAIWKTCIWPKRG